MSVLQEKAYKESQKISRYTSTPYYYHTVDNKYIMGTPVQLKDDTVYTNYIVQVNDTYDSLALKFYGNPTLYWIICSFNRVADPLTNPQVNSIIKIPSISNIEFDLQGRL